MNGCIEIMQNSGQPGSRLRLLNRLPMLCCGTRAQAVCSASGLSLYTCYGTLGLCETLRCHAEVAKLALVLETT